MEWPARSAQIINTVTDPETGTEYQTTLGEYTTSWIWAAKRQEWANSDLPQECYLCQRPDYELHHRHYRNLGRETADQLVPLCPDHHYEVEKFLRRERWLGVQNVTRANAHIVYKEQKYDPRRRITS